MSDHEEPLCRDCRRSEERGAAFVIGLLLFVAVVVTLLAVLQVGLVPQLVAETEFQHNEQTQGEVSGVLSAADRTTATASGESVVVRPGVRYQYRTGLIHPPPASGTVRTTDAEPIVVENAVAETVEGETIDYWSGPIDPATAEGSVTPNTVETRTFVYEPSYNEYGNAPQTVVEPGVVYNRFGERTIPLETRPIVDGDRISLTALTGEFQRDAVGATQIDVRPRSAPRQTVSVTGIVREGDEDTPIRLTIPTGLSPEQWETLLEDELVENGGNVAEITASEDGEGVVLELRAADDDGDPIVYDLRLAQAGLGPESEPNDAEYITDIDGERTIQRGERATFVAEVRDRFDNPVVSESVEINDDELDGQIVSETPKRSQDDGRVSFVYDSSGVTVSPETGIATETITLWIGDDRPETPDKREVTFRLTIEGDAEQPEEPPDGIGGSPIFDGGEEQPGGPGGGEQAEFDVAGDTTGQAQATLLFSLRATQRVEISGISVDRTTEPRAVSVWGQDGAATFSGGGGEYRGGITIGGSRVTLQRNAVIERNQVVEFRLGAFRRGTQSTSQFQNMNNKDITITLFFADGSSVQFTIRTL
ncbi:MAG: hypothetical protein PPP58_02280 [Natronomonas sp.]